MDYYNSPPPPNSLRFQGLALVAVLIVSVAGLVFFTRMLSFGSHSARPGRGDLAKGDIQTLKLPAVMVQASSVSSAGQAGSGGSTSKGRNDPRAIAAPYKHYKLTQGLHGFSYGHAAIDIAAGQGAVIRSPISGRVTALYVDEYGNPTLVIENEVYQVTLMHGEYTVEQGQAVEMRQPVGKESNLGYTLDALGQLCAGRPCGYHTHLNIFDKQLGANVNPLDLIGE